MFEVNTENYVMTPRLCRKRATLVLEIDQTIADFEISLRPITLHVFLKLSTLLGSSVDELVSRLVERVDGVIPAANRGPAHPAGGRPHHIYRVGRQVGKRVVILKLSKHNFPRDYDFGPLLAKLQTISDDSQALLEASGDDHHWLVQFLWMRNS